MSFVSVKMILISTGILSVAMGLKLTVPVVSHFIISEAPSMWSFFLTCFTPPYLYILLNFIILTILASFKFHHSTHDTTEPLIYSAAYDGTLAAVHIHAPEPVKISGAAQSDYHSVDSDVYVYEAKTTGISDDTAANGDGFVGYVYDENSPVKTIVIADDTVENGNGSVGYVYDENAQVKTTVIGDEAVLAPSLQRKDSLQLAFHDENEKPPVSARFSHRKTGRTSPEGGKVVALGVAKSKKQDTLESTWRTITEGRAMPLTRHHKRADTWDSQPRRNAVPLTDLNGGNAAPVMKKSETFAGREKSVSPGSGGKLRKEPSLSQDELNRRVEAFINKFNAEMRLQRQESLRQYREMINRGAR
ncbi:uncharacterized protein LOC133289626 isoform X1 [Gastrolobium bilobum]|uniref:uncharacterized protein LOC133289626 isoform X1 n=1 Tax=Gastrolobium bilobum TaxID=150636 RepID=UPI002AB1B9E1|nr:uncharacterized protein LOC133289626 isoform X1 [Gastrolobium bilobum]